MIYRDSYVVKFLVIKKKRFYVWDVSIPLPRKKCWTRIKNIVINMALLKSKCLKKVQF